MINITPTNHYMGLDCWIMANVIQLATFDFCRHFLKRENDPCGRMFDQMTQAARSIQANIAEGTSRHQTSTETEMRLLDVARASASELASDYMFVLMSRGESAWAASDPAAKQVSSLDFDRPCYGSDFLHDVTAHIINQHRKFHPWLKGTTVTVAANALLIMCSRESAMITRLIKTRLESFKQNGGFTENLTRERQATQAAMPSPRCPVCGGPMARRVIKRGSRQGQEFWGCLNYPKCNGTLNVNAPAQ